MLASNLTSLFYLFKSGSSFRKFNDNMQYIKIYNKNLIYNLPNWNKATFTTILFINFILN
jgi:hypothetical protein